MILEIRGDLYSREGTICGPLLSRKVCTYHVKQDLYTKIFYSYHTCDVFCLINMKVPFHFENGFFRAANLVKACYAVCLGTHLEAVMLRWVRTNGWIGKIVWT